MGKFRKGLSAFLIAFALTFGAYAQGRELIPGGQLVGVTVKTDGLVYVGASDLGSSPSPARLSGLKNGDVIKKINGVRIDGVRSLTENVQPGKENTLEALPGIIKYLKGEGFSLVKTGEMLLTGEVYTDNSGRQHRIK